MDADTIKLIQDVVPPLLDLQKVVTTRLKSTKGIVGKLIGFWVSEEYLVKLNGVKQNVKAAVDALTMRVQVHACLESM